MGKFIYYGRSVEPTLLVALREITVEQEKGTTQTEDAGHQFLDNYATHSNAKLYNQTRNMILKIYINKSYLSELK